MATFKSLTKDTPDRVKIFPYKDIEVKDWPSYYDGTKYVPYAEEIRDIGFIMPYPTPSRLTKLQEHITDISFKDRSAHLDSLDPKGLAHYMCFNLIVDVIGIEDEEGNPIDYKHKENKEHLTVMLAKSSFLLNTLRSEYEQMGGRVRDREVKEDENFTDSLNITSEPTTKVSRPQSEAKKEAIA